MSRVTERFPEEVRAVGEFADRMSLVSDLGGISRCIGCRHLGLCS